LEIVSFEPDAPGPGEGDNDNDGHGTHVAGKFDWFLPYCSFMTFAFLITLLYLPGTVGGRSNGLPESNLISVKVFNGSGPVLWPCPATD
jgi:hypothetical protein